jgi:hypothetical protein
MDVCIGKVADSRFQAQSAQARATWQAGLRASTQQPQRQSDWKGFHPAGDDGKAAGPVDGEESEGVVEVHTYVGGVVACFERCAARNRLKGGNGGGFEALGEESGQHILGAGRDGQRIGLILGRCDVVVSVGRPSPNGSGLANKSCLVLISMDGSRATAGGGDAHASMSPVPLG